MTTTIAVAGKGGVGKTTIAGLIARALLERGKGPVLAVDADPNANLHEALGLDLKETVGQTREAFFESKLSLPAGVPKETYLELRLNEVLIESPEVDLLTMGRPEGPGCYCYINNVMRKHIDVLTENYPFVVIDNEAGMEHLSRRTTQRVDFLLIVSDYSRRGIVTARRIWDLARDLDLQMGKAYLIIDRAPPVLEEHLAEQVDELPMALLGTIPVDEKIGEFETTGRPLRGLPESSPAVQAVNQLMEKMGLFN